MTTLTPCGACRRHVRDTDATCPFCAQPTPMPARHLEASSRLGRAAMFAFRATTLAALATLPACGGDATAPTPSTTTPTGSGGGPQIPPSGTPPPETGTIYAPYGAPPTPHPDTPPVPPPAPTGVPEAAES